MQSCCRVFFCVLRFSKADAWHYHAKKANQIFPIRIKCNVNQQKWKFFLPIRCENTGKKERGKPNDLSDMALDICGRKNIHIVIACTRLCKYAKNKFSSRTFYSFQRCSAYFRFCKRDYSHCLFYSNFQFSREYYLH